ncbi:hypothetical protein LINPERHAP1_LOCUS16338 [Linum perenne]
MKNRLSCKMLLMVVSTYQAASGVGAAAMEELELQTREEEIDLLDSRMELNQDDELASS